MNLIEKMNEEQNQTDSLQLQEYQIELQKALSVNQELTEENQNLRQELSEVQRVNLFLTRSNDDLRNNNGLMQRKEQESLIAEVKDVRDQNCELEHLVDMSSVETVKQAENERNKAIQKVKQVEYSANRAVKQVKQDAEVKIKKMTKNTKQIQEKAQSQEMIWRFGMMFTMLLAIVKNQSIITDFENVIILPIIIWNKILLIAGWGAAVIAIVLSVIIGLIGRELIKKVKEMWNDESLFFLVMAMEITLNIGDIIKRVLVINQLAIFGLLCLLLLVAKWRLQKKTSSI